MSGLSASCLHSSSSSNMFNNSHRQLSPKNKYIRFVHVDSR